MVHAEGYKGLIHYLNNHYHILPHSRTQSLDFIPSVIAFLMAAPWANLAYTIPLFSLFGVNALYIIISAIIIVLIAGFVYQILDISGRIEKNPYTLKVKGDFRSLWKLLCLSDGGVASDYTEIGILWSNIGERTALYLPLIAGPQIILLGYLFNILL